MQKTNAMRILDSKKLKYTVDEYDISDGMTDGISVAKKVGKDPSSVFKTLVTCSGNELFVFGRPVKQELDLKRAAKAAGKIAVISAGWDPGMFSLNRLYANAILTDGKDYTFWGKGVSQGHSDAIRRIEGVQDARQYTIPVESAMEAVRAGKEPELSTREKHTRLCYVVAKEGADKARIENEIKTMPNYFSDYDTTVHFISQEELDRDHKGLPHGGCVIRSGKTGWENEHHHVIEYRLTLDSNPEFTSSVIVACARAAFRMEQEGQTGCRTMLDIPPAYLSAKSGEELRRTLL